MLTDEPGSRRTVSVSIDDALVKTASERGLDLSSLAEAGIRRELRAAAAAREWADANATAIEANNLLIAEGGLWSDALRLF